MPDLTRRRMSRSPAGHRPVFHCLHSDVDGGVLVAVSGELDIATVPQLDCAMRRAWETTDEVVVLDLRALEFADSSGAHEIVAADRRIRRAGGRLIVVRGPAEIEWLFALTRIDELLELVDELPALTDDALRGGRSRASALYEAALHTA